MSVRLQILTNNSYVGYCRGKPHPRLSSLPSSHCVCWHGPFVPRSYMTSQSLRQDPHAHEFLSLYCCHGNAPKRSWQTLCLSLKTLFKLQPASDPRTEWPPLSRCLGSPPRDGSLPSPAAGRLVECWLVISGVPCVIPSLGLISALEDGLEMRF